MHDQQVKIIEADAMLGGGRYDFSKIPAAKLQALYAKKERNVHERARFFALKGHAVVGFMLADFRILVSGKHAVFITNGYVGMEPCDRGAAGLLLLVAMTWAQSFEDVAYVKVEDGAFLEWSY